MIANHDVTINKTQETNAPPKLSGKTLEIPVEILSADNISPINKLVYLGLLCYPDVTKAQLLKNLNISRASLWKSFANLERLGYITQKKKSYKLFSEKLPE